MREKQQGNPEFAFLFGGQDAAYYRWRIYCMQNNWSEDQIAQQVASYFGSHASSSSANGSTQHSQQQLQPIQPPSLLTRMPLPANAPLAPELESEFKQLLGTLSGSKDSIKDSRK